MAIKYEEITMPQIALMLQLQQQLNDATNGKGWEQGMTKQGKPIDWRRCIYLECAELIDSYPWKHWKNIDAQADSENIKIEVVDIWHFVMSEMLRINSCDIEALAEDIKNLPNFQNLKKTPTPLSKEYFQQIETIEKFIKTIFDGSDWRDMTNRYFDIVTQSGLNLDTLYQLYIGKNILNQFRQDHGYKEGSYIKIWNNEEDNVVMQNILNANSDITPKELYEALQEVYSKL